MDMGFANRMLGAKSGTYRAGQIVAWPRTSREAKLTVKIASDGTQIRTVLPAMDSQDRLPLASMSELQKLMIAKLTGDAKVSTDDGFAPRTGHMEVRERLASTVLTPEILAQYLDELEKWGTVMKAAEMAGVNPLVMSKFRKNSEEYEELCQMAIQRYREALEHEARRRAVQGWDEPIIGGKERDRVVAHVRKYDSNLMIAMLKRHIPEYRDKYEGEIKITGGVLLVPATSPSSGEWQKSMEEAPKRQLVEMPPKEPSKDG